MFDRLAQEFTRLLTLGLVLIVSVEVLRQIAMLAIALIIAWLLQFPLRRLLNTLASRLNQAVWSYQLLPIVRRTMFPLTARILGQLAVEIWRNIGWSHQLMTWANYFFTLWLLYRFLSALLRLNLSPARAQFWSRKILLPIIFFTGLLHSIGLLDNILDWGLTLGQSNLEITVGSLLVGLVIVAVFLVLSRGIGQFLRYAFLPQAGATPALAQALSTLVTYVIAIIGAGLALSTAGLNLTTLTFIAGGLSIGLGFGLQEIVNNFVSGFIILFEHSISPGDVIKVNGEVGVVENVGIRSVTIKTRDNIELIVPNSYFLAEMVVNLTRSERIVRARITVRVTYEARPRDVEEALLEAARHPRVLSEPPPTVQFHDFGEDAFLFDLLVWTDEADKIPPLTSDLRYNIWEALAARNIEIPFPQRDVYIRSSVPLSALISPIKDSSPSD